MYGNPIDINYQTVIKNLSIDAQLTVWSWILSKHVSIGQTFTSPFRHDVTPGCRLRVWNNMVMMGDNKYPEYSKYNCLHGINYFRNTGLNECAVFVYINLHFNKHPILTTNQVITGKTLKGRPSKSDIHFIPFSNADGQACFTKLDLDYWQPVGVTCQDLIEANVFSIKHFFVNGTYMKPQKYPAYAYVLPSNRIKIYVPYASKDFKWFGSQKKEDIWKFSNSKKLLITKSLKDVLVLKNILVDWEIWSFASEGTIPNIEIEQEEICFLYDNDTAGYKASERLVKQFGGKALFFDEDIGKDSFEIGSKSMDLLKEELKRLELL